MVLVRKEKKVHPKKTKNKRIKEKHKNKINSKANIKVSILLYSVVIVCFCIFLLSRYAHITEIQMKVTKLNKEVVEQEEKKHLLNLELEEIKDSGWIEEQAKIRMNMRKANGDQIVYLDVKSE